MLHSAFVIIFVVIVTFENINCGYLLVEIEDDSPIPSQPETKPPPPNPRPTLPPPPSVAPPPLPTKAPEVWIQEGEPCVPRYGYRATDIRTLAHQANECANGLECKHTGYSGHICIRLKPGYKPWIYELGVKYIKGIDNDGKYNNGQGGSYNNGHGGSYNHGKGGSYNNGKGGSYNNGKGESYNDGWGNYV